MDLHNRSKIYDTSALKYIFMLNNFNYIEKSLTKYVYLYFFYLISLRCVMKMNR